MDTGNELEAQEVPAQLVERIFTAAVERLAERQHVPTATYRLQFNRFFTFAQARALVPYLHRLGISDLYASPYFRARAESLHGYDVASHNELNPELGSQADYDALVGALRRHDLYQLLDTVPNHMGIGAPDNAWWQDVLENGRASLYAAYFDIDWNPLNPKLTNKVLLPILGEQYGTVLERGELQVRFVSGEGRFSLHYYETILPLAPRSYQPLLDLDKAALLAALGAESEAALEYQSILTALSHLPPHWEMDRALQLERSREKEVIKRRLAALCAAEPRVREQIERNVVAFNGQGGDPRSFDRLDALLEDQPYRLSFWRVATEEINYRRFFDVNELAAIRVELPPVFEETHRTILQFLREGRLHGLRIDHVDGLRDPAGYLHALQRGYFQELCRQAGDDLGENALAGVDRAALEATLLARFEAARLADPRGPLYRPLYVVVEKILGRDEALPADWAAAGTTGYEFTNAAIGLLVDGANAKAFDEIYGGFIGERVRFADLVYESKQRIMRQALSSEVTMLTNMLNHISERDRHYRDFTISSIRNAIREVIACFPVYRTYTTPAHSTVDKRDQAHIEAAVARAKRRNPALDPSIFDFLRDVLLLQGYDRLTDADRADRFDFVLKFQQVTGPVIAKGLEDTAFYVYNRLIALNEVGGEPGTFGISPAAFHRQQAERQRHWPAALLTTSTHDTKRSEDVRARIAVLSELPKEWRTLVRRWARLNRKHKATVDGQLAPSPNEEYFLYQTLLGVWPFGEEIGEEEYNTLIERVRATMRKAMNEAKVNTSWVNPNEPYQAAVAAFIAAILRRAEANRFLPDFLAFQRKIAHYGAFNSLAQVLLKIAGPGVPDIYQGNELWDFSLVDPDNRRPVDYALRARLLTEVEQIGDAAGAAALVRAKDDGRIKLLVTARALHYRRAHPALFAQGGYIPLAVEGPHQDNIVAFARGHGAEQAIAVAPRLLTRLARGADLLTPTGAAWAGSWLPAPGAAVGDRFRNIFTGEVITAQDRNGAGSLLLEEALAAFPVALLEKLEME
jgi:(1->4)-alpha-D-glucan 1-alpha-D-glucosylmutase